MSAFPYQLQLQSSKLPVTEVGQDTASADKYEQPSSLVLQPYSLPFQHLPISLHSTETDSTDANTHDRSQ